MIRLNFSKLIRSFLTLTLMIVFTIHCNAQGLQSNTKNTNLETRSLTPPMGWNSYNCYGATVRENEVKANADFMAKNLLKYGWNYVVVDFCWSYPHYIKDTQNGAKQCQAPASEGGCYAPWLAMDEYGRLFPHTVKFPSAVDGKGFKPLADYVHSLGLKFGIHVMRGIPRQAVWDKSPVLGTNGITADMIADTTSTCMWLDNMYGLDMSKPGAQEYLNSLFQLYASWGVDFVKIDDLVKFDRDMPAYKSEIIGYRKAIDNCGRNILFSSSPGPSNLKEGALFQSYTNLWRTNADFWDNWKALHKSFEYAHNWTPFRSEGHWPDLDMIQLGRIARRGPVGKERDTNFTPDEQRTHITLWCIAKSPLFFGGELTMINDKVLSLITNEKALKINQQGIEARQLYRKNDLVVWVSKMKDSKKWNVALFNLTEKAAEIGLNFSDIGLKGRHEIFDVWLNKNIGKYSNKYKQVVPPHGSVLLQLE